MDTKSDVDKQSQVIDLSADDTPITKNAFSELMNPKSKKQKKIKSEQHDQISLDVENQKQDSNIPGLSYKFEITR